MIQHGWYARCGHRVEAEKVETEFIHRGRTLCRRISPSRRRITNTHRFEHVDRVTVNVVDIDRRNLVENPVHAHDPVQHLDQGLPLAPHHLQHRMLEPGLPLQTQKIEQEAPEDVPYIGKRLHYFPSR